MNEKECIDRIVSRLNNWKFESAWRYSQLPEFPSDIYRMIQDLSKKYGDIGWVDGSMGIKIDRKVEEVMDAMMAHYKYHFIFQEGVTDYSVDEALEQRKIARQEGDYALSDKIREKLDARNVFVFDTKDGQEVYFSLKGTMRESIINQMNEDRRANKMFDAWLYSVNKSRR